MMKPTSQIQDRIANIQSGVTLAINTVLAYLDERHPTGMHTDA
ncbi:MAG: hypothetical protein ACAI35_01020 [Candidatus Methylacidiphilales bacterium]|nr:hypothetical protein [Candidatus Methylacidiphilales bacterium]